jgi:hypothetical protein
MEREIDHLHLLRGLFQESTEILQQWKLIRNMITQLKWDKSKVEDYHSQQIQELVNLQLKQFNKEPILSIISKDLNWNGLQMLNLKFQTMEKWLLQNLMLIY